MERLITLSTLKKGLIELGVCPGDHLMLHVSVKNIGWLVGGPDIIVMGILDLITERGTLMMYCGWEDGPYTMEGWNNEKRTTYYDECPPFDPRTSRAVRAWGVVTEIFRTWPGTVRSNHPDSSFCANGHHARYFTENHSLYYGFGKDSPLEKLIDAGGKILLLGAPFNSITLLHHSEDRANVLNKPVIRYSMPMRNRSGLTEWRLIEEFDTNLGIGPGCPDSNTYFDKILSEFIGSFSLPEHCVGNARTFLLDSANLNRFSVRWLEKHLNPDYKLPRINVL